MSVKYFYRPQLPNIQATLGQFTDDGWKDTTAFLGIFITIIHNNVLVTMITATGKKKANSTHDGREGNIGCIAIVVYKLAGALRPLGKRESRYPRA